MAVLHLVPNPYVRQVKRALFRENNSSPVMTISALIAHILKEGLISYKEDRILEEVTVWQVVQEQSENLRFFAPIAHYSGFIQELRWLFNQIDFGEEIYTEIPEEGQQELELLHTSYHQALQRQGLLDTPGQIRQALELTKKATYLPQIEQIELRGLGELTPLENEFLQSFAGERKLTRFWAEVGEPQIKVRMAKDPYSEVEMIGLEIRNLLEKGTSMDEIGLAFPNPTQYLPTIHSVFDKLGIPWHIPEVSLRNTPLGKSLLTLIAGELEGWHKQHLQLLTAPGWGFPFGLSLDELRLLRLAPPLKGLPQWRSYLGKEKAWDTLLQILTDLGQKIVTQPVKDYALWLGDLLKELEPEKWVLPEENLTNWAELVKAWDGMQTISESLMNYEWVCTPLQFLQLFQTLLDGYQIKGRRVFADRLQILSVEQLGAHNYEYLFVGGLVEGQFPKYKHAHWLTKTRNIVKREELYGQMVAVSSSVNLYYPEVDSDGKLNLPATILPGAENPTTELSLDKDHKPSLFLGNGLLTDEEILSTLRSRILEEGLSVSQLNSYANCPYQFFCSHILELAPEEEVSLELAPSDHGSIIHDVLFKFWSGHLEGTIPSVEQGERELEALLRAEYVLKDSKPSAQLLSTMRRFIRQDLNLVEQGFRPRYLEKWFQGVVLETSYGAVELRGRIDRIDFHPSGAYILYDYKTGTAPTIKAMLAGEDVQMATYLLASENLYSKARNVGVAYYLTKDGRRPGIYHEEYKNPLLLRGGPNLLDDDKFLKQNREFKAILERLIDSILEGRFPIEPANTRICSFCPFQGICRKEVGL